MDSGTSDRSSRGSCCPCLGVEISALPGLVWMVLLALMVVMCPFQGGRSPSPRGAKVEGYDGVYLCIPSQIVAATSSHG